MPCYQLDDQLWFPSVDSAEDYGLLAVGGDLSPERLLFAYSLGIFPWYNEGEPILWWSPDPRCVIFPNTFHVSRSLRKKMRRGEFQLTLNRAFDRVIQGCRTQRKDHGGTWITRDMLTAYHRLHLHGFAHSLECWEGNELVGGLYGLCLGRCFFGESMFSLRTDASKVALAGLARTLARAGFELIDCQQTTEHLLSLGACEISRDEFVQLLADGGVGPEFPLRSEFPRQLVDI
ncbi:MAG: leucyl/phenylalanyl-tRNA--protein transferase [Desulfuromonadales bacterium]|nr:leucyl/phenylalanyl-tRNA--protein transferase [Desulfuromonadales bacterium]